MTAKIDYKKQDKALYLPKGEPVILDVPAMSFVAIEGEGDPNRPAFALETEALYALSYAVKMSYKGSDAPAGYYDYTVYPLEGVWGLVDLTKPSTDKNNWKYTIMIRQPDFLTEDGFRYFVEKTAANKPNAPLDRLKFITMADGPSCQMMHTGSFEEEPASFARMEAFCAEAGYRRASRLHREIYLSDPRRTAPEKLRTVLRFAVAK
ncbi:GyrI-like domain-containing protein [Cohnella hashimotonis]|uniref:GyrI-like domain-containing protein n=1 Tax=Cohnella hashimotonis TaxID=2826895 RepID=A0ABT6TTF2_9BACL|nr:GyrI-like domain-containing protein [Cohnella hashimotonis]MDI4650115.1 GyrI-like domain-containing protein [Cohnella hashimotonis]